MSRSASDPTRKVLVFVTGIPSFVHGEKFFRTIMRKQAQGVMEVKLIDHSGYGLILFESVNAALAACVDRIHIDARVEEQEGKSEDTLSDNNKENKTENCSEGVSELINDGKTRRHYLHLRCIKSDNQKKEFEETYQSSINIQGETYLKSDLVPNRGLQLLYRGQGVGKWCRYTKEKLDCPLGFQCKFLHLKMYQRTEKRQRGFFGMSDIERTTDQENNIGDKGLAVTNYSWLDEGLFFSNSTKTRPGKGAHSCSFHQLLPPLLADPIPVTVADVRAILNDTTQPPIGDNTHFPKDINLKTIHEIHALFLKSFNDRRNEILRASAERGSNYGASHELLTSSEPSIFLRLDSQFSPGTTSLSFYTNSETGREQHLKTVGKCYLPKNGAPTPTERDSFVREVLAKRNLVSAIRNSKGKSQTTYSSESHPYIDAFTTFLQTDEVISNMRQLLAEHDAIKHDGRRIETCPMRNGDRGEIVDGVTDNVARDKETGTVLTHILVFPHYRLTSVLQEISFFVEDNKVVCVAQHHDKVLSPEWELDKTLYQHLKDRDDVPAALMSGVASTSVASANPTKLCKKINEETERVAACIEEYHEYNYGTNYTSHSTDCIYHVAFPTHFYASSAEILSSANNDGKEQQIAPYLLPKSPDEIPCSPDSLHISVWRPFDSTPTAIGPPVILAKKKFIPSTIYSTLASTDGISDGTANRKNIQPIWRKRKTCHSSIFPRESVLDMLAR
eukprot:Tbor_TRINITY_DN4086_c0_g1::TRINITY_DN4086_c0_g1_i1::g.11761::m.11761